MSWISDLFGGSKAPDQGIQLGGGQWQAQPNYAETDAARQQWGDKLTQWGNDPGYGAIPSNWNDIWNTASRNLDEYYHGSPTTPGALSKVQGVSAMNNTSDSPALAANVGALEAQGGQQLSDMAVQKATAQAQESEAGRQNWLTNITNMANLKQPGQWNNPQVNPAYTDWSAKQNYGSPMDSLGSMLSSVMQLPQGQGSSVGGNMMGGIGNWFQNLFKQPGGASGTTTDSGNGVSSGSSAYTDQSNNSDWMSSITQFLPSLISGASMLAI
jgi:hypothetical protein